MRDLTARVTEILEALAEATHVSLVVSSNGRWVFMDPSQPDAHFTIPLDEAVRGGRLPGSVLPLLESTIEPFQVPDLAQDERFSHDPYFAGREACSLLLIPVAEPGAARAMLLLERDLACGAFDAQRMDAVMLIAGQLTVSLANAQLNDRLEQRVHEHTIELESLQKTVAATAHKAGMAQIATNVLHNIGNVLNGVTVSTSLLKERIRRSPASGLSRAVRLMKEHESDLGNFLTCDERGVLLPRYLAQLDAVLSQEREDVLEEISTLQQRVQHIAAIISNQSAFAGVPGLMERTILSELLDETLRVTADVITEGTRIVRGGEKLAFELDRHRLLHILVNLVVNACEAMETSSERVLSLDARVASTEEGDRLLISVGDTGQGFEPQHLQCLFTHGFTTKPRGHGFGLHSSAVAATEMGGRLTAHSDGPGLGATFTLELPARRIGNP
jgi:signal transduction histidine kinase